MVDLNPFTIVANTFQLQITLESKAAVWLGNKSNLGPGGFRVARFFVA